jgi:plasmid stability protein
VPKARTTITLDERVLQAVRVKAARSGRSDSDVIEEALRRDLGLDVFERVWQKAGLDEEAALHLAVEAQHQGRRA